MTQTYPTPAAADDDDSTATPSDSQPSSTSEEKSLESIVGPRNDCGSQSSERRIGQHSMYACGASRPLLRGWLHGCASVAVFIGTLLALVLGFQLQDPRWIFVAVLLVGKLSSYAASGVYHLYPFQEKTSADQALMQ